MLDDTLTSLRQEDRSAPPRARGTTHVSVRARQGRSVLAKLYQAGSMKTLFPHGADMTAVLLNTAGGVTGGDQFHVEMSAHERANLTVTTQAAERIYQAQPGQIGTIETRLEALDGSRIDWLPQETIVYNKAGLVRRLRVELHATATLLLVEPVVMGRTAMGEVVDDVDFRDSIEVVEDGCATFVDRTHFKGDTTRILAGPATGAGATAYATVLFRATNAADYLEAARQLLGPGGGISALSETLLCARIVARDSFDLRKTLVPLASFLRGRPLPRTWMI